MNRFQNFWRFLTGDILLSLLRTLLQLYCHASTSKNVVQNKKEGSAPEPIPPPHWAEHSHTKPTWKYINIDYWHLFIPILFYHDVKFVCTNFGVQTPNNKDVRCERPYLQKKLGVRPAYQSRNSTSREAIYFSAPWLTETLAARGKSSKTPFHPCTS